MSNIQRPDIKQAVIFLDAKRSNFFPLTLKHSIADVTLLNIPSIDYLLELLIASNFEEIYIVTSNVNDDLKDYLKYYNINLSSSKWSLKYRKSIINLIISESCNSPGDVFRELYHRGNVIKNDFIFINGVIVSNINFKSYLLLHKNKRQKEKIDLLMSLVYIKPQVSDSIIPMLTSHRVALIVDDSNANSVKLVSYYPGSVFQQTLNKRIQVPIDALNKCKQLTVVYNLLDIGVCICSPQVPQFFADNFDYQTISHFITDVLINEEILGSQIHVNFLQNGYALPFDNLVIYPRICLDLMNRWLFPIMPERWRNGTLDQPLYTLLNENTKWTQQNNSYVPHNPNDWKCSQSTKIGNNVFLGKNVCIADNTRINRSIVGQSSKIGSDCHITNCIIWSNVLIDNKCKLNTCILSDDVYIGSNTTIGKHSIVTNKCKIPENIHLPSYSHIFPSLEDLKAFVSSFEHYKIFQTSNSNYLIDDTDVHYTKIDNSTIGSTYVICAISTLELIYNAAYEEKKTSFENITQWPPIYVFKSSEYMSFGLRPLFINTKQSNYFDKNICHITTSNGYSKDQPNSTQQEKILKSYVTSTYNFSDTGISLEIVGSDFSDDEFLLPQDADSDDFSDSSTESFENAGEGSSLQANSFENLHETNLSSDNEKSSNNQTIGEKTKDDRTKIDIKIQKVQSQPHKTSHINSIKGGDHEISVTKLSHHKPHNQPSTMNSKINEKNLIGSKRGKIRTISENSNASSVGSLSDQTQQLTLNTFHWLDEDSLLQGSDIPKSISHLIDNDVKTFYAELCESFERIDETAISNQEPNAAFPLSNLILEINASKHAYNIDLEDVWTCLTHQLIKRPTSPPITNCDALLAHYIKRCQRYQELMRKYFKGSLAQSILLDKITWVALQSPTSSVNNNERSLESAFPIIKLLHYLYNVDLIDEPHIIEWFDSSKLINTVSQNNTSILNSPISLAIYKQVSDFVTWLKEAEEEDESD